MLPSIAGEARFSCAPRTGAIIFQMSAVTLILDSLRPDDPAAADKLLPLVYAELRKLAAAKMARETPNQTLQPTALVHEAWLRLVGNDNPHYANRAHFFSAAAEAMRRILIDNARRKKAARHGGNQQRHDIADFPEVTAPCGNDELLALNEALDKLAALHALQADVVKLRYFVGMTNAEAAQALNLSERTVNNYWNHARAWLAREVRAKP